jgi:hypothetical protein
VTFYRLFPFDPDAPSDAEGGPLFVARHLQGGGRHDNPESYGALYVSRVPVSPVAEHLRVWRARGAAGSALRPEGRSLALAALEDSGLDDLVDLDDPRNLVARTLRPSAVATRERTVTRPMARAFYEEGLPGFEWWSTIESSWINVTLFADRALGGLRVEGEPEVVTIQHPSVREAAEAIGVELGG